MNGKKRQWPLGVPSHDTRAPRERLIPMQSVVLCSPRRIVAETGYLVDRPRVDTRLADLPQPPHISHTCTNRNGTSIDRGTEDTLAPRRRKPSRSKNHKCFQLTLFILERTTRISSKSLSRRRVFGAKSWFLCLLRAGHLFPGPCVHDIDRHVHAPSLRTIHGEEHVNQGQT